MQVESTAGASSGGGHARRTFVQSVGNVFLGIAIGLIGYYFATDLLTTVQQRSLSAEFPSVEPAAAAPSEEQPFDWEGWDEQDRAFWESLAEGEAMGRIVSAPMGLDAVVVKGTSRSDLMKGPGHIDYSDLPSPEGNFGVAGHRTTYGAPFRNIDRLDEGDTITFRSPYRLYTYRVIDVFSVTPDRTDVMRRGDVPMITLSACHPPYSARFRMIAQAELVAVQKLER